MANFQYEALNNKSGKTEKGELPAASQAEALARLQEMGLSPMKVEQAKAATKKTKQRKGKKGAKKSIGQMQLSIPGMAGKVKECSHDLHPSVGPVDFRRLASSHRAQSASKAGKGPYVEAHLGRIVRGDRGRRHVLRRLGPASQGFQQAFCQHGQGG